MGMSDLNERLNQLEQGALNLLFPRKCPFCNRHIGGRDLICGDCEKTLPYTGDRARRQVSGLRVAAPLYYEDAVRRALLDFKFNESDIIGLSQKAFKHLGASMMI